VDSKSKLLEAWKKDSSCKFSELGKTSFMSYI
jgi:hypothetical protein